MEREKILSTARNIRKSKLKSAAKNFFLMLDLLGDDTAFYQLANQFPEHIKQDLLNSVIKLLEQNNVDEQNTKKALAKIVNVAYLRTIDHANIKKIKKLRRAIYDFGVKNDIALTTLLAGSQGRIDRKKTAKRIAKHADKFQNFANIISKQNDWVKLAEKLESVTGTFMEPLSLVVTPSKLTAQEVNDLGHLIQQPKEYEIRDNELLPEIPNKKQNKIATYITAVREGKISKYRMEKYLEAVQKQIAADETISLEDMEDVKKRLLKLYHKHKLSQDISIIDNAIRKKEQADVKHYNAAFDEVKKTLDAVVGYRIVYIKIKSLPDVEELKTLSEKYNNNPILISYNGSFLVYGYGAGNVWRHTYLEQKIFDEKITLKDKTEIKIRDYLDGIEATEEQPKLLNHKIKDKLYSKLKKAHSLDGDVLGTVIRAHSPKIFSDTPRAWKDGLDYGFFQIINLLANLGLHKQLEGFKTIINNLEKEQSLSNLERMQRVLDHLYGLFNALSVLEDEEGELCVSDENLKLLKKYIHAFAEKHHFEKKLFNLYKLYKKNTADEEVSKSLHHTPNRKYAYIDNLAQQLTQQKINERKRKKGLSYLSTGASLAVGIGEGVIAAVFFGAFPLGLLIGLAGFAVNYFLFRSDSNHTLKEFFARGIFKDIFKDEKGNEISLIKKIATSLALISVIGASIAFAIFTFSSVLALVSLAVAFPPLAFVLAVGFAVAMFISNTGVFYRITSEFIKNDRIVSVGRYLKKNFYDVFKPEMPWADLTKGQKVLHCFKVAGKLVFNTAFLALSVGICATITALTLGLGYKYAYNILAGFVHLQAKISHFAAAITIYGIASPANSFFYWKGNISVVNAVKSALEWVGSKFGRLGETISKAYREFNANKIRRVNVIFAMAQTALFIGFAVLNGIGQGGGAYHTAKSVNFVQKVWQGVLGIRISQAAAKLITYFTSAQSSFAVNTMAVSSEMKVPSAKKHTLPARPETAKVASKNASSIKKPKGRNDVSFASNYFVTFGKVAKNPNPQQVTSLIHEKDGMLAQALQKKRSEK